MTTITQNLPILSDRVKHALLSGMRDFYDTVGKFLPNKEVIRTPVNPHALSPKMPQGLSYSEIKLWQVDTEDHNFRANYFSGLPDFLSSYFANEYIKLFQTKSRKAANTFLRKTLGGNIKSRLDLVNKQYEFIKPSTLSINFSAEFDNLPTFGRERIAELSVEIARYIDKLIQHLLADHEFCLSANEVNQLGLEHQLYKSVLNELDGINIVPPYFADYKNGKLTNENIVRALAKLTNEDWWYNKLKTRRDFQHEHLAIAVGQVQKKATPYASQSCQSEWKEQKRRNKKYLEQMAIENQETGEQIALDLQVYKSISNPAIRRAELMTRMRGFEDLADEMGYTGAFITLTAPSKYHSTYSKGGFVENWQGNNPRETQAYLCKVWSRIRAKLNREDIKFFGFRVAEPHHDGTPHWHILVFMRPEDLQTAFKVMWIYAMDEDGQEKGAAKNRFEFTMIDKEKGSATGYIAKYISKNIDGYALDNEVDDETGENLKETSKAVTAWASRWKIRQFQQLGGAPVTVWRELRRLKSQKVENKIIDPVLASADIGDWAAYTNHQGGPMVLRKDLKVRLSYEEELNQYEEVIKKIKGVFSPLSGLTSFICTRLIKWKIVKKEKPSKDLDLKKRAARTPWSSVNNCTQIKKLPQCDQREEIRKQLKTIGLPDDNFTVNRLYLRESIKISHNQYLKLDNTLNGVHLIVSNSPSRPRKPVKNDFVEFDF
ncbi:replication endonuclease [Gilliamella sp. ESL0254]|uniref:replication endonuclease n=1 Tax=Gilliamella sp. ESL0254 TaxID=2705035 RepID=UPI001580865E|nr:replication endonuclease [Gilliamella sp. ESL0254]NUF27029.1 replication endonuclease [Gilliamella sp. ESL0254]